MNLRKSNIKHYKPWLNRLQDCFIGPFRRVFLPTEIERWTDQTLYLCVKVLTDENRAFVHFLGHLLRYWLIFFFSRLRKLIFVNMDRQAEPTQYHACQTNIEMRVFRVFAHQLAEILMQCLQNASAFTVFVHRFIWGELRVDTLGGCRVRCQNGQTLTHFLLGVSSGSCSSGPMFGL